MIGAVPVGVVAVGVAVALIGEARGSRLLARTGKPVASAGFLAAWFVAGAADRGAPGGWLAIALVLSAVGDLCLLGQSKRMFQAGIVAFLAGHLAFGGLLVSIGVDAGWTAVGAVLVSGVAVGVWRWLGPHVDRLRGAVIAYVVVISSMVALSVGALGVDPAGRWGLTAAAVAFFLSDLFVARNRFVRASPVNRYVGLPIYYCAQLGWVAALLAATGPRG